MTTLNNEEQLKNQVSSTLAYKMHIQFGFKISFDY